MTQTRVQKTKSTAKREAAVAEEVEAAAAADLAATDALLADIDAALADALGGDLTDQLAQDFVGQYVQKGGQ